MKRFLLFILLLLVAVLIFGAKVTTFKEPIKPGSIAIDKNQIFIVEGATIYIYSLNDFSLQKTFGKRGEGPEEFIFRSSINRGCVTIDVQSDYIIVNSIGKVSFFTRNGIFKKEIKTGSNVIGEWFTVLNNRFIGAKIAPESTGTYFSINSYDNNIKNKNEIYKIKVYKQGKKFNPIMATRFPLLYTHNDKIFVDGYINDESGVIHVFEKSGKKLYSINPDFEKLKVTEDDKNRFLHWYKTNPATKEAFEFLKQLFIFPTYFPQIRWYNINDGKIFVLTYKRENGKNEFYIFNLKGKLLKKIMLPFAEYDEVQFSPYTINDGKLYQLIENDNETWELHVIKISSQHS